MKKLTLLICFLMLGVAQVFAQAYQGRQDKYWEIGFQVNAMNYFGDLNPMTRFVSTRIGNTRPSLFLHASHKIGSSLRIRGSFGYGRVLGSDFLASGNFADASGEAQTKKIVRYGRNLHFRNDIKELAVTATYDLLKSYGRYYRRRFFTPYILGGVAVYHHNPKAVAPEGTAEAGKWVALQPLGTEGQGRTGYQKKYGLIQPAVLIGVGARMRVSDRLDLGFEIGWRVLFTNHLDDIGGNYADLNDLDSQLARRMADRSAEPKDALTGKTRDLTAVRPVVGQETPNYGGAAPFPNGAGQGPDGYTRLGSYGLKGDVRGLQGLTKNDVYTTIGFHLNYILTSKRTPRYSGN